ncbi:MAG: serine hydrolase [Pseudomonadota bacterium]
MQLFRILLALIVLLLPLHVWADGAVMEDRLRADFAAGKLGGLHSVLVLKDDQTFAEVHFKGQDWAWGDDLGVRQHGPETLHDLRSVTKSIVSLLYGIALGEGKVPPVDASLYAQFPEYPDLAADPERAGITIEDALTMRMGLKWDESGAYVDSRNSEIAMEMATDRYRYVLDQPIVGPPGEAWNYSGGATVLIGRLIEKGTGMRLDAFAEEKLFSPLGITEAGWNGRTEAEPSAASGLRLSANSLAKIGRMIIANGVVDGVQIVPADWLEWSMSPHTGNSQMRYGYFWWMLPGEGKPPFVAALGNGGQRFSINPGARLVFVSLAGNYNQKDDWHLPLTVIRQYLGPALSGN